MVGSLEGQCQHNWREWVHERQAEREAPLALLAGNAQPGFNFSLVYAWSLHVEANATQVSYMRDSPGMANPPWVPSVGIARSACHGAGGAGRTCEVPAESCHTQLPRVRG